jgi:N-methylhydantoinase A
MTGGHRLGVDIGGTFTDLVLVAGASGATWVGKTLTTPDDPAEGVRRGIEEVLAKAGLPAADVDILIHGTTLVANAIIERKGARTAFVATRGFRDLLLFRREFRYDIYDLGLRFPPPLVRRRDAFEVDERIAADGSVLRPLETTEAERVAELIVERGYEAVAICFLHSFANPSHERRLREVLAQRAPATSVSLSSEVLPQIREYERACATAINAFVQPVVSAYLDRLDAVLRSAGFGGHWYVMASSGKILSIETARRYPVQILESGPAAGALAAAEIGARMGTPDLLSFDMGGTTAKASLVAGGRPTVTTDFEVARVHRFKRGSGFPVKLPVINMIEIGAGGGSIAHVNALGLIEVGPESAGAEPGPACYGRGGEAPTVTDANLVLGYLDAGYFLGGEMRLDRGAAERALERLGRQIGLDARGAALGVHRIVTANMAEAIRTHAAEKGVDYRRLPLVAFGGAGPVHAFGIARTLGISQVVFPPAAGALSAWGFLSAPLGFDFVRSHVGVLDELDPTAARAVFDDLERQAHRVFSEAGVSPSAIRLDHAADVRYRGQGFEVTVALSATWRTAGDLSTVTPAFEQEYKRLYGRLVPGVPIEVVSWRLGASGPKPTMQSERRARGDGRAPVAKGRREVLVDEVAVECGVYERDCLLVGNQLAGPALVEERECTLFIGRDSVATVNDFAAVVVDLRRV